MTHSKKQTNKQKNPPRTCVSHLCKKLHLCDYMRYKTTLQFSRIILEKYILSTTVHYVISCALQYILIGYLFYT